MTRPSHREPAYSSEYSNECVKRIGISAEKVTSISAVWRRTATGYTPPHRTLGRTNTGGEEILLLALLDDLAHNCRYEVRWDRKTNAIGGGGLILFDGPPRGGGHPVLPPNRPRRA